MVNNDLLVTGCKYTYNFPIGKLPQLSQLRLNGIQQSME